MWVILFKFVKELDFSFLVSSELNEYSLGTKIYQDHILHIVWDKYVHVVYFDQQTGAPHTVHLLKSIFYALITFRVPEMF